MRRVSTTLSLSKFYAGRTIVEEIYPFNEHNKTIFYTTTFMIYIIINWYILAYGWHSNINKVTRNSFKKWPLNLWWISNKTLMKVGNITKAATFKSFFHLRGCSYGGELARLGGLARLSEISPSSYKNITCSYEKWASPPKWDLTWFCWDPTITFFVTVLFNIFMRQTLTDDFWRLHKNINCAFPSM